VATVVTNNLAVGVVLGVLVAMVAFANRVAHFVRVDRTVEETDGRTIARYTVEGELFFASSNDLYTMFRYAEDPAHVVIDMHRSHMWDASTVAAMDSVMEKYRSYDKQVDIIGLNQASRRMRVRLTAWARGADPPGDLPPGRSLVGQCRAERGTMAQDKRRFDATWLPFGMMIGVA